MPGRLVDFVARNKPSAGHAKNIIKSSLHNAAKKSSPTPSSVHSSDRPNRDIMEILKRHSMALKPGHSDHARKASDARSSASSLESVKAARMDLLVESPPLLSFNRPAESSGALFSGQLRLFVDEAKLEFESIQLQLICSVTYKRPVDKYCAKCARTERELKSWNFAKEQPLTLARGEHKFPVSYLFDGELAASTQAYLGSLDYRFVAVAKTTSGETINFSEKLELGRAILPGNDKQSIRVFPPTNITANVTLNPTVHQFGEIPISMRLAGLTGKQKDGSTIRWRLRRLNWRIEEHQKLFSNACEKHLARVTEGKTGTNNEEIRTVGEHEVNHHKNPWKADYEKGEIETEFTATINAAKRPVCDVASAEFGLSVSHFLVLEMVVAEEFVPHKRPSQATPTGSARILRAQFPLTLTQRAGLGVAWDEETPPVYQDVPASPPCYQGTEIAEFDLAELGDVIEDFHLEEPRDRSRAGTYASSSSVRTSSTASSNPAARRPMRFSADDLLQEPPEARRPHGEEEAAAIETTQ